MIFRELDLPGAYVLDIERLEDHRGFFARTYCEREFASHGVRTGGLVQTSISWNAGKGTVRGMHFQRAPSEESKLVRCVRGRILDVIIDLRPASATYTRHVAVELDAASRRALYVPPGFAHGFQTLEDDTEVWYGMDEFFDPGAADGVRWDDPAFRIEWPLGNPTIAERDRSYPPFDADAFAQRQQQQR